MLSHSQEDQRDASILVGELANRFAMVAVEPILMIEAKQIVVPPATHSPVPVQRERPDLIEMEKLPLRPTRS